MFLQPCFPGEGFRKCTSCRRRKQEVLGFVERAKPVRGYQENANATCRQHKALSQALWELWNSNVQSPFAGVKAPEERARGCSSDPNIQA